MNLKTLLQRSIRKTGYQLCKYPADPVWKLRKLLFEKHEITTVLDVGANIGQFAGYIRDFVNFKGRVVSFEPVSGTYAHLKRSADRHKGSVWETKNYALGDSNGTVEINIAGNTYSSSILNMLPAHESAAPESKFEGTEEITVKTLDSVFDEICDAGERIYLKIDTQGYEEKVIRGASNCLSRISMIQMELSVVSLYENELLFHDMCRLMEERGFHLVALEQGFSDPKTGHLLQVDGVFLRAVD